MVSPGRGRADDDRTGDRPGDGDDPATDPATIAPATDLARDPATDPATIAPATDLATDPAAIAWAMWPMVIALATGWSRVPEGT